MAMSVWTRTLGMLVGQTQPSAPGAGVGFRHNTRGGPVLDPRLVNAPARAVFPGWSYSFHIHPEPAVAATRGKAVPLARTTLHHPQHLPVPLPPFPHPKPGPVRGAGPSERHQAGNPSWEPAYCHCEASSAKLRCYGVRVVLVSLGPILRIRQGKMTKSKTTCFKFPTGCADKVPRDPDLMSRLGSQAQENSCV